MQKVSEESTPETDVSRGARFRSGLIGALDTISDRVAGVLFILNIMNIAVAVFMRYILLNSFIWTAELSQFMLVWIVLIGASSAWRRNEHMQIDLVVAHLPSMLRRAAVILRDGIVLLVSLFMTIWGIIYANSTWRITTLGLKIPKAIPLFAISIGMGAVFLMSLLMSIGRRGPAAQEPSESEVRDHP